MEKDENQEIRRGCQTRAWGGRRIKLSEEEDEEEEDKEEDKLTDDEEQKVAEETSID